MSGDSGSSSSSSSSNTTQNTTYTTDKRMVVDGGAIGITSDSSTVNVQSMDAGIVTKALETVASADATSGAGFSQLLGLADKLFVGAGEVIGKTQDTTMAQIAAVNSAANDSKGAIDQKTIVILAGAAVAAYAFMRKG